MYPALFATSFGYFWYAVPLIVAISLVYGATRHELMHPILQHAFKAGIWIVSFMLVIFFILHFMAWKL